MNSPESLGSRRPLTIRGLRYNSVAIHIGPSKNVSFAPQSILAAITEGHHSETCRFGILRSLSVKESVDHAFDVAGWGYRIGVAHHWRQLFAPQSGLACWHQHRWFEAELPCPTRVTPVIERKQLAACATRGKMQRIGKIDPTPAVA